MPGMTQDAIDKFFASFSPTEDQITSIEAMWDSGQKLASKILKNTPSSPEQTVAIRKVQEAVMWSNAAIALNKEDSVPERTDGL